MNWDAIGVAVEIVGAVAVVVSLVYLATQMRQNANAVKASNRDSMANHVTETLLLVASDGELASIFMKGQSDPASMSDEEAFRFDTLLYTIFDHWETFHSHWKLGAITDDDWEKWESIIAMYMSQKGASIFWENWSQNYSSTFREFVDSVKPKDHVLWHSNAYKNDS